MVQPPEDGTAFKWFVQASNVYGQAFKVNRAIHRKSLRLRNSLMHEQTVY